MGVYLPNLEMPENCFECPWRCKVDPENLLCRISGEYFEETFSGAIQNRHKSCPLVPVPPHGDLIDRDALINDGWLNLHKEVIRMGGYAIHELPLKNPSIPVIIPASGGQEDE